MSTVTLQSTLTEKYHERTDSSHMNIRSPLAMAYRAARRLKHARNYNGQPEQIAALKHSYFLLHLRMHATC